MVERPRVFGVALDPTMKTQSITSGGRKEIHLKLQPDVFYGLFCLECITLAWGGLANLDCVYTFAYLYD